MQVKEKLTELFIEHGFPIRENDRSLITNCPQCGKENHFYIFKESGFGKCMKCGESFSPEAIVVAITACTFADAKKILQSGTPILAGDQLKPHLHQSDKAEHKQEPLRTFVLPADFFMIDSEIGKPGFNYLNDRGIDAETMATYDLRFCPAIQRVVFPVYMGGVCVGWQGRDVTGNHELRYMSPQGLSKARVLLGWDLLTEKKDYVILTEGPVDCLKTAVLKNALCSMGKDVSNEQIRLIQGLKHINRIYLALDPDAFMLFDKIAQALEPEKQVFIMQPPPGKKDFGECTTTEVLKAFRSAIKYGKASMLPTGILK